MRRLYMFVEKRMVNGDVCVIYRGGGVVSCVCSVVYNVTSIDFFSSSTHANHGIATTGGGSPFWQRYIDVLSCIRKLYSCRV
ncbi:hypothetical protein L2E82_45079 [Cichorium intybus]|uniref:Uncharacterized protein n=1 Tax=Cichorium intybus TaxID=13427 RepID=A0ACB8ZWE5_CICIN|nr:hypothetical protein L2E82_45079 [Cichorium intybus]